MLPSISAAAEHIHKCLVVSYLMIPENTPYNMIRQLWKVIAAGATLNNQLVFDLFSKTMLAANFLHSDKALVDSLQSALAKLPPCKSGNIVIFNEN